METLQPTKQNDMVANNNNYKVSKNKQTIDEEKKKKRWQVKIDNEHLKNINKIEKYRKLNMTEHKTDMNITKTEKFKKS